MANELSIRRATEADTEEILRLVILSLGEYWNRAAGLRFDTGFWSWKHLTSPFGASPCLIAEAEGRIVGLRVFMRWQWQAGETTVQAVRAVDTATHPDWRGRGIFSSLTLALVEEMRQEGVSFVFNTPNASSGPGYLKMKWVNTGRTSPLIRPLRPLHLLGSLVAKPRANGTGNGAAPAARTAPTATRIGELFREPALDGFLRVLDREERRLRTPRSRDYLQWRYRDIPGGIYDALWEFDGTDGAVLIFRQKHRRGFTELRFCELLVGPSRRSAAIGRALLRQAVADTEADYASAMAASGTAEQRVVLGSGFLPAPRLGPILTVRSLNALASGLDPLKRPNWRVSLGDLELF